jgi:hypothetical protein
MTDELTFVDTNVLLCAYDRSAGHKHSIARAILRSQHGQLLLGVRIEDPFRSAPAAPTS